MVEQLNWYKALEKNKYLDEVDSLVIFNFDTFKGAKGITLGAFKSLRKVLDDTNDAEEF